MLETEEVDDDYFTPKASTSLANIFNNTLQKTAGPDKTLKYVPPKPQNTAPKSDEEPKSSQCLFACALIGYEWFNNTYTSRGKLGFAIIKILKSNQHNMVLYDSNKTTLSCTIINPQLEITVNKNTFISYYDNTQKYWSIYATEEEINKIEELLKSLNVSVKYSVGASQGPTEIGNQVNDLNLNIDQDDKGDKETDTDSSMKQKTKISILNRMASMGHSVLPIQTSFSEKTSDSSDTNDSINHPKAVRHKPSKTLAKKNILEKHTAEQKDGESLKSLPTIKAKPQLTSSYNMDSQLIPVTHTNIISSMPNCDMNMYMTEQRICNSELRINMTRISDKIDQLSSKVNDLESKNKDVASSFQMEVLQKLLTEYENKIKFYENLLKSSGSLKAEAASTGDQDSKEINTLQTKVALLELSNKDKDSEIIRLGDEIKISKNNMEIMKNMNGEANKEFNNKIAQLEKVLQAKSEETTIMSNALKSTQSNIEHKLKAIMNDTFRTLCTNFKGDESYNGEDIKAVIATVIKKVTVDCLSES